MYLGPRQPVLVGGNFPWRILPCGRRRVHGRQHCGVLGIHAHQRERNNHRALLDNPGEHLR